MLVEILYWIEVFEVTLHIGDTNKFIVSADLEKVFLLLFKVKW